MAILKPVFCDNGDVNKISETAADDDATWIGINVPNNGQSKTITYTIEFEKIKFERKALDKVENLKLRVRARTSTSSFSSAVLTLQEINLLDKSSSHPNMVHSGIAQSKNLTSSYQDFVFDIDQKFKNSLVNQINTFLFRGKTYQFQTMINLKGTSQSGKESSSFDIRVTQVQLEFVYTTRPFVYTISLKDNGEWVECPEIYQKVNGTWERVESSSKLFEELFQQRKCLIKYI